MDNELLKWLLNGDPAIRYQTLRDLTDASKDKIEIERRKIENEGWGAKFLSKANPTGGWGLQYYQPKWISTHYTLLDLKNIGIYPENPIIKKGIDQAFTLPIGVDGGLNVGVTINYSDVCVNGMILNFASYFRRIEKDLIPMIDYLLKTQMDDGGWNCCYCREGAKHSSLHTTISTLEGLNEYLKNGYTYKRKNILESMTSAHEFILVHRLYKSDHTGKIINKKMTMLSNPPRWRYDILRAMDYFRDAEVKYDNRMDDAINLILSKRRSNGRWPVQAKHAGEVHFDMEKTGEPSRWNTLRVLRVFKNYHIYLK